jgi:DNA-binding response OmpR family regulator
MPLSKQLYKNGALTLFYADDDKDDALIFQEVIADISSQIKVHTVHNGNELCELLSLLQPDMIFLDLEMPDKNGLECLVEIRKMAAYTNLPVVVYSSTTRLSNIETAYEMGADLFFIKPYTYEELLSSLTTILRLDWSEPSKVKEQYLVNGRYVGFL